MNRLDFKRIQKLRKTPNEIFAKLRHSLYSLKAFKADNLERNFENGQATDNLNSIMKTINYPRNLQLLPKKKKNVSVMFLLGEFVYISRPLIHCYSLKIKSSSSYFVYVLNLLIDVLWIFIHFVNEGASIFQNPIIKQRLKNIFINNLLRSPFYDRVLKKKVLINILNKLFNKGKIRSLLIRLVDFRSSLSYVM